MKTNQKKDQEAPKSNASAAAKKSPSAGKRKAAAKTPVAKKSKSALAPSIQPSDEEIRTLAYFISERRHRLALPGDASADWLEAKRQLGAGHERR